MIATGLINKLAYAKGKKKCKKFRKILFHKPLTKTIILCILYMQAEMHCILVQTELTFKRTVSSPATRRSP